MNSSWDELIKSFETGLIENKTFIYEYRIYYNKNGEIIKTTVLETDPILDIDYIIVDKLPDDLFLYCVFNKKLKKKVNQTTKKLQLVKSDQGFKVVKNHPALVLYDNEQYKDTEFYNYVEH